MDWGSEEFIVDDNTVFGSSKELMVKKIIQIKLFQVTQMKHPQAIKL
jgi:hypothetical protein